MKHWKAPWSETKPRAILCTKILAGGEISQERSYEVKEITVVDARMGRGKSTAAIRYMNERKGKQCFLFVTPYLTEVGRVCEKCDFSEPGCDRTAKSTQLKLLMRQRKNIASTHALFSLMDDEALAIAKENDYSLIIDESISVIQHVYASARDTELLVNNLVDIGEDGRVTWREPEYEGKFSGYKEFADSGLLLFLNGSFYSVMNPDRFAAFDEVFMLTYLFDGQLIRAYFDFYGMRYRIIGIETDDHGYRFSDKPDDPTPIDYANLIHIVDDRRMNGIGDVRTALSAGWFSRRSRSNEEIKLLRNNLRNYMTRMVGDVPGKCLWTTYKDNEEWLLGPNNRFKSSFLSLNARATNAYREATKVAYLVNRFVDPNINKFFATKNINVDSDQFALSEMLQFIWRSAIRDDKEIYLYIPSRRMRKLLTGWIDSTSGGNSHA